VTTARRHSENFAPQLISPNIFFDTLIGKTHLVDKEPAARELHNSRVAADALPTRLLKGSF
jgi:hypothetical protein